MARCSAEATDEAGAATRAAAAAAGSAASQPSPAAAGQGPGGALEWGAILPGSGGTAAGPAGAEAAAASPPMSESEPFVDHYLPALLGQAWHLVSSEFHAVVESQGLSVLEWRVLSTLVGNGPMGISRLAQKTVSKQPTVTRLLDRLEAQGHVQRVPDAKDGRVTRVRVTRSGRKLVSGLLAQAELHEKMVLASLGARKSEALKAALHELIDRYGPAD